MFEDLELPDLERKILKQAMAERVAKRKGYRKAGIRVRLDRRRTVKAKLRRKIAAGVPPASEAAEDETDAAERIKFPFRKEDLTYKRLVLDEREESNAVVVCIMDTSGSMDTAEEVPGAQLLLPALPVPLHQVPGRRDRLHRPPHRGEGGHRGGVLPQGRVRRHADLLGLSKALEIIQERYHPDALEHLRVPLLGRRQLRLRQRRGAEGRAASCASVCNLFGYGEIKPMGSHYYESSMLERLPPARGRELPVRPDRAQRGHLAVLQGLPVARPGDRRVAAIGAP